MPIAVRDLEGKVVFHIDGEVARDDHGKVVAEPSSLKHLKYQDEKLSKLGSVLMRNKGATEEGRKILLDLGISDVSTPATVGQFGMIADGCIGDMISEPMFVNHDRGVWYIENVTDLVKIVLNDGGAAGASTPELNPNFTPTTFITSEHAYCAKIPRQTLSNADFDLRARTTRFLIEAIRLRRELRIANLATTSTNWNAANLIAAAGGGGWNGAAGAPLTDLFAALQASMMPADVLVMPENIAPLFFQNGSAQVRDYVQAGGELPRVLFSRAKFLSSGAASYVWAPYKNAEGGTQSVNIPLLRVQSEMMLQSLKTFRWLGDGASHDGKRVEGILVRNFKDKVEDVEWIVVVYNDSDVMLTPKANLQVGALITGAAV